MKFSAFGIKILVIFATFTVCVESANGVTPMISIDVSAPGIIAFLTDSSGLRTGADPNIEMNSVGQEEVNGNDYVLRAIPNSGCLQNNLEGGQPTTQWEMTIANPTGIYVLNYSSNLSQCAQTIAVDFQMNNPYKLQTFDVSLLASKTIYKQLKIVTAQGGLTITPIVNPGDLLVDTQSACSLDAIKPVSACEALVDLAQEVEKEITKGDTKAEAEHLEVYLLLLDRIHFWGKDGQPGNWDRFKERDECKDLCAHDLHDKFSVTPQVYSALKVEAETLLGPIKKQGDHDWRDDHP